MTETIKVRTRSIYGDEHSAKYIEPNKVYEATYTETMDGYKCYTLVGAIDNKEVIINPNGCAWLAGNPWEVVEKDNE